MKTNVGRQELLQWINEFTECDYPRLELCCDGIGYCQVLDAIHPGIVNLSKLNFLAKYPDDYMKNLKVLDDAFNKLEIEKVVPMDKLCKGKFQDNMRFLQWLYNYANKSGPVKVKVYKGYERRMEALVKQRGKTNIDRSAFCPHLIPNNAFLKFKPKRYSMAADKFPDESNVNAEQQNSSPDRNFENVENYNMPSNIENREDAQYNISREQEERISQHLKSIDDYLKDLEGDLKNKMEYNWKLLYAIEDMMYQRNTLYNLLTEIEEVATKNEQSEFKETLQNIISHIPNDFKFE